MGRVLTTGIGSLPFMDAADAARYVRDQYDVPFRPQLVRMLDAVPGIPPMLREMLTDDMLKALKEKSSEAFLLQRFSPSFNHAAPRLPPTPLFSKKNGISEEKNGKGQTKNQIKDQIAGPHTFAALVSALLPSLPYAEGLAMGWDRCEALTRAASPGATMIIWDDALLPARASRQELDRLQAFRGELAGQGVRLGIHSCAPGPFAPLAAALPGHVLAIDLAVIDLFAPAAMAAARRHIAGGGAFIFGVIDTRRAPFQPAPRELMQRLSDLVPGDQPILISGGCGTGLHTADDERRLAQLLRTAAA